VSIALRVSPEYADEVQPGMTAKVNLSAHKARSLPMLTGVVTYVSPRVLEDQRSGQAYFLARLSLDRSPLKNLPVRLLPGMPVRVEIPTGANTTLEYLIEPIAEVMHNGMREK
jgi:multidrug efflux pump subunit AcrA (membrane-fusion protein)